MTPVVPSIVTTSAHAGANRVLPVPVAEHRLVDDDDGGRAVALIEIRERPAGNERHAERLEVVGAGDAHVGRRPLVEVVGRVPFGAERGPDGKLTVAPEQAREHQVRDVRAGDQQDEPGRRE
jgi:hypothetical protein